MKTTRLTRDIITTLGALGFGLSASAAPVLEEVVVTATKRAENIQDVPISISAFSGAALKDSGTTDLQQLSGYAPNLSLSKSGQVNNARIAIRGVGSVGNSAIEPSVAVFIDGVYYPRPGSVVGKLQDIEAIEVLRGPQGTLFGRNASMGALNIRTRKPEHETTTDLSLSVGNYDTWSTAATFNGSLSDNVAGRLALQYSERGGFGHSDYDGAEIGEMDDAGIRGSLNFELGNNTEATLRADWKKFTNNGTLIDVVPDSVLPIYLARIGALLDPDISDGSGDGPLPYVNDAYDLRVNQKQTDAAEDEQWGLSLDIEGELGDHSWRSITSYRDWDNSTYDDSVRLPADLLPRDTRFGAQTFSQELQLLSNLDGAFQYVAGVYYYREEYSLDQDLNFGADFCSTAIYNNVYLRSIGQGNSPAAAAAMAGGTAAFCNAGAQVGAVSSNFEQEVSSLALFAQGTYDISESLSATLGLRWTDDDKDGRFAQTINNPLAGPAGLNLRVNESADLKFADSQVTWMANLRYTPSDDLMFFFTASSGYKAGGFNSDGTAVVLGEQRVFDSEEVLSYELGLKSTLFDRMTVNATLFRTDIDNFQDRLFNGLSFVVVNAGELRQQGLEVDINAQLTDNLKAIAGLSLLDSEFLDYPGGTNLPGFDQTVSQDLKGASNNFSPDYQASLALEWRAELNPDLEWFVRGEYQYVDEQSVNGQTDNNPAQVEDAVGQLNARLGLVAASGRWDITLYGRNLSDEGYCQATFYQPLATTLHLQDPVSGNAMTRCVVGEPRTYGIELNAHF